MIDPAEPNHGFDDSRRLTGPNRYFASTAVVVTPLGLAARDPQAHSRWQSLVREQVAALGWFDAQPMADMTHTGVTLTFAAPDDQLFTATEVNEWAWERAAFEAGERGSELAQDHGGQATDVFAARASAERKPALKALQVEALRRALPLLVDDELCSIGAGATSCTWPMMALPMLADVPWATLADVPTALVTGSNGKTTTVRLLAAIAHAADLHAGYCCTEGVVVDGVAVASGDWSGPAGARAVLRHPDVQAAVLETARGGILRRGLAVQRADVAVVTNISADHFGEYGVDSAEQLAQVKLVVARALRDSGTLVLNADDETLMQTAAGLPHVVACRQALFALDDLHQRLVVHRSLGGSTCGVHEGALLLSHGGVKQLIADVSEMPITLGGAAAFNIANAAAAALAAACMGWPVAAVKAALKGFGGNVADNPGRLERWRWHGATVLIDYAHNPDGLAQLLRVARALSPQRLGLLLGQAGNRDDAAIAALAHTAAAFAPDHIVIKELPEMLRGRALGDVPDLLRQALQQAGHDADKTAVEPDELAAAQALLAWARPGDVVVLPVHTSGVREALAALLSRP